MTIYPEEQKARLIERMLGPQAESVPTLSRESGIPKDTLYGWRQQARRARGIRPLEMSERWSSEQKFAMVVETAVLNEAERSEYCRKRGLYPEHLHSWRRACERANGVHGKAPSRTGNGATDQRRIEALERELRRKEKALAEAAALLVLRKKADAIWDKDEDV
jgi:transposase-like protein